MKAGGGETVARAGGVDDLGREAGRGNTPLRGLNLSAVRAERGDERGDEPRKRALERRIHEGARLRIAEDEIEAFDRIEQSGCVFRAVGALDVERGRRRGKFVQRPPRVGRGQGRRSRSDAGGERP